MNLFETHYSRWNGRHTSIWSRRWTIAFHGMRASMQGKLMKWLIGVAWSAALMVCVVLFLIGQILVPENLLSTLGKSSEDVAKVVNTMFAWLNENPDVSVSSIYNLVFFSYTWLITFLSLIAVTKAIPHLMTQDLSSKSLIIYTSKAINRFDYVIGKTAALFGVMAVIWFLPCLVAWIFSNSFAPEWHFFWHSRDALVHSLSYLVIAMGVTSIMGLAFSAISANPRTTTGAWLGYWAVCWVFEEIAANSPRFSWLKFTSLRFNLSQIQQSIFNLEGYYEMLTTKVPGLSRAFEGRFSLQPPMVEDAVFGTAVLCILSLLYVLRKVDSES
jgi:hypothetical protein